jgi:hypothetical protein
LTNEFVHACCKCGKIHKFCSDVIKYDSWRRRFCSPECFQEYTKLCEDLNSKPINAKQEIITTTEPIIAVDESLLETESEKPKRKTKSKEITEENE